MKVFKKLHPGLTRGTSLSGHVHTTYRDLVRVLGEPTSDIPTGDDKSQVTWVIDFKGDIFTIYDWKTYDREYTLNELDRWNVGSIVSAREFIEVLNQKLDAGQTI